MMEKPIITKIKSQKCVGYEQWSGERSVAVIENIGIDASGQRWKWTSYNVWVQNPNGLSTVSMQEKGDYRKASKG